MPPRQAFDVAIHNAVRIIINDNLRVRSGLQICYIRFDTMRYGFKRNVHLVITGLDICNIYVRPGGDGPFHRLAIYSTDHFAIIIGDRKGIVNLQGSILERWEIDSP